MCMCASTWAGYCIGVLDQNSCVSLTKVISSSSFAMAMTMSLAVHQLPRGTTVAPTPTLPGFSKSPFLTPATSPHASSSVLRKERCFPRSSKNVLRNVVRAAVGEEAPSAAISDSVEQEIAEADYVVIGSGVGGLCCGGLLAWYGHDVVIAESHSIPGGVAHSFNIKGYNFDSGPSTFSALSSRGPQANPLAQVLDALGESVEYVAYNSWMLHVPEGQFLCHSVLSEFYKDMLRIAGPVAVADCRKLVERALQVSAMALAVPPAAVRTDWGALETALGRYGSALVENSSQFGSQELIGAGKLLGSLSHLLDFWEIDNEFVRSFFDLATFIVMGLKADDALAAEMVYMFGLWIKPKTSLEYPLGGVGAIIDALVRGLEKHKGRLLLNSHVETILVEGGRAVGVKLRNGKVIRARKGVISNASSRDTVNLIPAGDLPPEFRSHAESIPDCRSFVHLHLGIDAKNLPSDLEIHHVVVNDWAPGVDAPQNVVLISIPSVLDPSLAPPGKHVLHAYTPGAEPYEIWEGLDRKSAEYRQLKAERSEVLWKAVEKVLGPSFSRDQCDVKLVGSPLTHERFTRRIRGTFGPEIRAGKDTFAMPATPVAGLFCCGDYVFPHIGVPAVAASGMVTANSLVSVDEHKKFLEAIGL